MGRRVTLFQGSHSGLKVVDPLLEQLDQCFVAEALLPLPAQSRGLAGPRRDHRQRYQALWTVRAVDQA
ncbi:hypothetical protein BL253_32885 [Pseudofrankia asymbiotica]|uniref:Uncharacterized protein n=1 Tax=Pseudofrankia asymbiotica TaxID=1834516 RepID=A0A1V2I1D2_9ACTN|nr:hypothetical protein BL253_32885 [Pseudofrankia asymbiotica]